MNGHNISRKRVKHRGAKSSPNQNQLLVRGSVNIPDDTWLEALKFLTCPQWMQTCFVCRQINEIVRSNFLRLPKMVLACADMFYNSDACGKEMKKLSVNKYTIVEFDTILQKKKRKQWFKSRGFTITTAEAVHTAENALFGAKEWTRSWDSNVNLQILGTVPEKIPLSKTEERFPWFYRSQFREPVLFYAQFNPLLNRNSWAYLAQFLKLIFHPTSYIKWINMYAINQDFIDFLNCNSDMFDNGPRYVHCESFLLERVEGTNTATLFDSLQWMAQHVRAKVIPILRFNDDAFVLFANFFLDPTGARQCVSSHIQFCVIDQVAITTLIEKFHELPHLVGAAPTIVFKNPGLGQYYARLGPNLIAQEVDSEGAQALYMISNGQNRMRISLFASNSLFSSYYNECKIRIYSI